MRLKSNFSLLLAFLLLSSPVFAQQSLDRDFDLTSSRIAPSPDTIIGAEGTDTMAPGRIGLSATFRWADQPLTIRNASGEAETLLVSGRLNLDFGIVVGALRWLEFGLLFPTVIYQDGENLTSAGNLDALPIAGTGDMRLRAKGVVFNSANEGRGLVNFGLGFVIEGVFPTGLRGGFLSDRMVGMEALIIGDLRLLGIHLALAVGYRLRPERNFGDLTVDDEFLWRVGLRVPIPGDFRIVGDITGAHGLLGPDGPFGAQDENPILWHLGFELPEWRDVRAMIAAGMGITSGYGAPRFDVMMSIRYQPSYHDSDSDGITDHQDQCPDMPEDEDGFQDQDGCPEEDNDQDGVMDFVDMCPGEQEDLDGHGDEDGCPEDDHDGDGVPDVQDECPDALEDIDEFEDGDGCPEEDNDEDQIPDSSDECQNDPEDLDGHEDQDGCSEEDNDQDGIIDVQDQCPDQAEDRDGIEDQDGCPE